MLSISVDTSVFHHTWYTLINSLIVGLSNLQSFSFTKTKFLHMSMSLVSPSICPQLVSHTFYIVHSVHCRLTVHNIKPTIRTMFFLTHLSYNNHTECSYMLESTWDHQGTNISIKYRSVLLPRRHCISRFKVIYKLFYQIFRWFIPVVYVQQCHLKIVR